MRYLAGEVRGDEDVGGLEVAVDDVARVEVGRRQCDLVRHPH